MLMQRSTARRILSFHQLAEADDVYPLMVEGGSTMNFFKVDLTIVQVYLEHQ